MFARPLMGDLFAECHLLIAFVFPFRVSRKQPTYAYAAVGVIRIRSD